MRTIVHTLAYHHAHAVHQVMQYHYGKRYERYLVDVRFPLENQLSNAVSLAIIARDHGCNLLRCYKNRGVAGNWNWVWKEVEGTDDDVIIGLDPDCRPQKPGWAEAFAQIMIADPTIASLHLNRPMEQTTENEWSVNFHDEEIAGYTIRFFDEMVAWSMMGFSGKFMNRFGLNQELKHYGYIEHWCAERMKEAGMRWGRIMDFTEKHDFSVNNKVMTDWKASQRDRVSNLTFEEFIKSDSAVII